MMRATFLFVIFFSIATLTGAPRALAASSDSAKQALRQLLLGKEVKSLIDLPATKEGVDIYLVPKAGKQMDERGLDLKELTKQLKSRGVGVPANQSEIITEVKFDSNQIEIQIAGGGEGRRGGKHAQKVAPGLLRAGGSRVNFRYERDVTDEDLAPEKFLAFAGRILDFSSIRAEVDAATMPAQFRSAIDRKTVVEGMTYQMVLLSFGDPEEKKLNGEAGGKFSETWYYMKDGHRWIIDFLDGKVSKIQTF
jgi:hypothetical protein